MVALSKNPDDKAAEAIVSKDRSYHSMLRTTCVATLLDGGHANNALPQRATANVNCRIFPGESVESTQAALVAAIGDPGVKVTPVPPIRPIAVPPPLDPKIIGPAEALVAKYFPGVPLFRPCPRARPTAFFSRRSAFRSTARPAAGAIPTATALMG